MLPGILLIIIGFIFLLNNLNIIDITFSGTFITGSIFFLGFLIFIGIYIGEGRREFWPLIPGFIFLGLAVHITSNYIGIDNKIGAGLLILFIGMSFLSVFILHPENWWAIIPGGIVTSISLVIFYSNSFGVGLMFLGMGCTFLILYPILKNTAPNSWWTFIPGGILGAMGCIFIFSSTNILKESELLSIMLIVIGIILVVRSYNRSKSR